MMERQWPHHRRVRRERLVTWRRGLGAGLVAGAVVLAAALPAVAASARVGTFSEAWYRGSIIAEDDPVCGALPVECPKVGAPEGQQPEDTLHVGVSGGRETARTYFELDLAGLPLGRVIDGGSVRLPLAGPDAGTTAPELADLVACFVPGFIQPVEGGDPEEAPEVDCSLTAPLAFGAETETFTFDLGPLTTDEVWHSNAFSVAILPSEQALEEGQTWRVAFHGRDRDTEDAEPISANVRYTPPGTPDLGDPTPPPEPPDSGKPSPPGETPGTAFAPPDPPSAQQPPTIEEPSAVQPPQVADAAPTPAPPDDDETLAAAPVVFSYAYPQVWLLPLVFLIVGALLMRSFSVEYEVELDSFPAGT